MAPAPAPAPVSGGGNGPGTAGYWIGGALLAIGTLFAIVLMASGLSQIISTVSDYRGMETPGEESFVLDKGEYRLYLFTEGAGAVDVEVLDAEGRPLPLRTVLESDEVTLDNVILDFVGWFETPSDGVYTVVVESDDVTGGLIFGPPIADSAVAAAGRIGLGVLLGGVLFVAGTVVLIVTAVRRSRAKQPRPPGGGYQPYPGQPYQGQPYQGQPYQGQPYQGQPYQAQPYQAQPYQAQPYPGQAPQGQAPAYPTQAYPAAPPPPTPPPGAFAHPSAPVPGYPTAAPPPQPPAPPAISEPEHGPAEGAQEPPESSAHSSSEDDSGRSA